jgi:hypothetical protein
VPLAQGGFVRVDLQSYASIRSRLDGGWKSRVHEYVDAATADAGNPEARRTFSQPSGNRGIRIE